MINKLFKIMEKSQNRKILRKYEIETQDLLKKRSEIAETEEPADIKAPKKRNYRMRAHCNPLSITPFP